MMLSVDGCIKSVKIYKDLEKLYNKKSWLFMTRKIAHLMSIFLHKLSDYYPLFSSIYIYI